MKVSLTLFAFAAIAGVLSEQTTSKDANNDTSAKLPPVNHGNLRQLKGNCGGGKVRNGVCSDPSLCCSEWGWCGSSTAHCKNHNIFSGSSRRCASGFDPRGKNGVVKNQYATYHAEYIPGNKGGSITVNCDDMAKVTLGKRNDMVAAMYTGEYGGGVRCGSCVLVEGPSSSAVVTIIDQCECGGPGSNLDLSPAAFRAINGGDLSDGIIRITWRTVSCSINEGKRLHYRFKQGSTKWWMQLAVVYNVDPIKEVEVWIDGRYYKMAMKNHGYWAFVESTPPLETPMKIRLTSTAGEVIGDELSSIEYSQRLLVKGNKNVQFTPGCPA